jgi:hypothetical protein
LRDQGCFAEALEELRRGHELGKQSPGWRFPSADWVRGCERLVALDRCLPAVLRGEGEPESAAECLELAHLCQQYKGLMVAATRLYADAFAGEPAYAEELTHGYRYDAACAAALGACGQGEDARARPDKESLTLRRQALTWLRADLALAATEGRRDEAGRKAVRQRLTHWRQDPDLATVRDGAALDQLPEDERRQWHQFWEEVAALLNSAEPRK